MDSSIYQIEFVHYLVDRNRKQSGKHSSHKMENSKQYDPEETARTEGSYKPVHLNQHCLENLLFGLWIQNS